MMSMFKQKIHLSISDTLKIVAAIHNSKEAEVYNWKDLLLLSNKLKAECLTAPFELEIL